MMEVIFFLPAVVSDSLTFHYQLVIMSQLVFNFAVYIYDNLCNLKSKSQRRSIIKC